MKYTFNKEWRSERSIRSSIDYKDMGGGEGSEIV
jgi:hypothetical protein